VLRRALKGVEATSSTGKVNLANQNLPSILATIKLKHCRSRRSKRPILRRTRAAGIGECLAVIFGRQREGRWHCDGWLTAGNFTCSWTHSRGEPTGSINVTTQRDAVVLTYQTRRSTTQALLPAFAYPLASLRSRCSRRRSIHRRTGHYEGG
jgi:hypothetical protein